MSFKQSTLKEQLRKIDLCQPMNEINRASIESDLSDIYSILDTLKSAEKYDDQFFNNTMYFAQPVNKQFFLFELPYLSCKYIIEFKQFNYSENDKLAKLILTTSLEYSLKILKQNLDATKALETIRLILDPERHLYKQGQLAIWDDTNFVGDVQVTPEQQEFCTSLKEGDYVDCLKQCSRSSTIDWSRGQVTKITNIWIWVRWLGDDMAQSRKLRLVTWDIAPYKSKVPDSEWDWRFKLQIDDKIDCPDDTVWYNSTIVDKQEIQVNEIDGTPQIEYKVGFRLYDPNGNMTDQRNDKRFFGWSSQYDEDVNATNPKIQKLNKYSKQFCKYASMSYAEESIKDQSDFVYEYQRKQKIYAVPRFHTRNQRRSRLMIDMIQLMGTQGLFDIIAERVKTWPIDPLHQSLVILGNIYEIIPRSFCYEYVPQIWESVQNNLLNSSDQNLRNFTSQKINEILNGCGLILKRVYSLKEKSEMTDKLEMNLALKCFNSDFLERKLQGLKSIQDLIKRNKDFQMTMQNSDTKFLTTQIVVDWINQNKIFEGLYVTTNPHLIQRSSDFLKFMLEENLVSLQHMEMVWASVKRGETEQKLAVYKLLKDVSQALSKEQLDFLIERIFEKDGNTLQKEDVEWLIDLTRYNYRHKEEFCMKFCNFYWKLLIEAESAPQQLQDQLVQFYIDQVTSFEMKSHRMSQIIMIAESILQGKGNIQQALKVLMKFIDKLEIQPLSWDPLTRNIALTQLEEQFSIINQIVKTITTETKIKMQFIQFFYTNITTAELRISFQLISDLWGTIMSNQSSEERDLLYRWFSSQSLTNIVNQEDLQTFFDTKIAQEEHLKQLTPEGFQSFKVVFSSLNAQSQKNINEFDPMKLHGFQALWNIIIEADSIVVSQLAIEFLQEIYSNVKDNNQLLQFIFSQFENKLTHQIYRILLVLEETIDQSEINGPGSLVSLNALNQSELITLNIVNDLNNGPKKIQVTLQENAPIVQLRYLIAQSLRIPWDTVSLSSTQGEVKFSWNGKMIKDLRLKKGEALVVNKRQVRDPPEKELLINNEMSPEAKAVFEELYNDYSTDNKMSKEQCARFVTACTGNPCNSEDTQIQRLFDQHDKDKDGNLLCQDFVEFYTEAARSKKSTVWQNLHLLGYRNDLLRGDKVPLPIINSNQLPRGIITKSQEMMNVLFDLLDSSDLKIQEQAWYLLRRLPPSKSYLQKILNFDGINTAEDWDSVLSIQKNFRLLYSLHIIEYLMNTQNCIEDCNEAKTDKWMSEFLQLGGFDRLYTFFQNYQEKSVSQMSINEKEILSFLLKTFSMYLVAASELRYPGTYQAAQLISQQLTPDQVLQALKNQDIHPPQQLLEKLSDGGLGDSILQKLQIQSVLKSIVDELLSQRSELESEDRGIIEYAVITLTASFKEEFLETFMEGLSTKKSPSTRALFARALLILTQKGYSSIIQRLTLNFSSNKQTPQYFELMCSIVELVQLQFNVQELVVKVLEKLKSHVSIETRLKQTHVDYVLVGLLKLLNKLILNFTNVQIDDQLPSIILNDCLFYFGNQIKDIKCKSQESRSAAFQLLITLSQNSQIASTLMKSICYLTDYIPVVNKWNHIPSQDMRNPQGYVGLKNLGCICYMNAMLQQFYMSLPLRYGLLLADDQQPEQLELRQQDNQYIDDNVLHQLQKIFAFLELSDRVDFNPHEFCFAFKDFTGEPVNILVQQDAQEFLNMILDRIETAIKPTPFRYLLDGVYGGKTCTQLVCSQCNSTRTREEQFYNLSLPIKNLNNLKQCFEKYIQGETISDFRCESCNQKVDVTKRQLLSELPNILILHLQRIVFNLDVLMNEKINHKVDFPINLDLKPYTTEVDHECTEYQLVGVVNHFGTAEFGHYFSYIDTKRSKEQFMTQPEQWLEFNDSKLKDFKTKQIEKECFGGGDAGFDNDDIYFNKYKSDNSQNAYMLVYEKKIKSPIVLLSEIDELPKPVKFDQTTDGQVRYSYDYHSLISQVPDKWKQLVEKDNQQFLMERNIFDPDLQNFILKLLQLIDKQESVMETSRLVTTLTFEILARSNENKLLETFALRLKSIFECSAEASLEFINQYISRLTRTVDLLLVCPELKTRQLFAKVLATAFNSVINLKNLDLNEENEQIIKALKTIFMLIEDQVPKNWVRLESYFTFWYEFMQGGDKQMLFMVKNQSVMYLIDFILEKQSPIQLYEKKHSMGNSYFPVNYENICQVINELVSNGLKHKWNFSETDIKLLYNFRFYDRVLKKLNVGTNFQKMILSLSYDNMYFQEIISGCILRGVGRADQDEMPSYLSISDALIKMDDQYKKQRIEWLLGVPQMQNIQSKHNFGTFGIQQLDEEYLHFTSPLGWQGTFLDYIVQNRTSKANDNQVILVIKFILKIALEDNEVLQYLIKIPSTNYLYGFFEDYLDGVIQNYIADTKRYYYHTFPREVEQTAVQQLIIQYKEKVQQIYPDRKPCDFLIGRTIKFQTTRKFLFAVDQRNNKQTIIEESTPEGKQQLEKDEAFLEKICLLEERVFKTYICDNLPNGLTNEALPSAYLKGTQFMTYSVPQNIVASNFIQPRSFNSNYQDNSEEDTEEQFDQSELIENQLVKNPRFEECIKQILVKSYAYKHLHAVVQIICPDDIPSHYIPISPIQSIIQPKGTAFMFTTKKNQSSVPFSKLIFNCVFKTLENDNVHLYLSTQEQIQRELSIIE